MIEFQGEESITNDDIFFANVGHVTPDGAWVANEIASFRFLPEQVIALATWACSYAPVDFEGMREHAQADDPIAAALAAYAQEQDRAERDHDRREYAALRARAVERTGNPDGSGSYGPLPPWLLDLAGPDALDPK